MKVKKDKVYLEFDHSGSGLVSKDGLPVSPFRTDSPVWIPAK